MNTWTTHRKMGHTFASQCEGRRSDAAFAIHTLVSNSCGGAVSVVAALVLVIGLLFVIGCAHRPANPMTAEAVFFVPGAAGDGGHYDELIRGLRAGGVDRRIEVHPWGAPKALFVLNFQGDKIHRRAESELAGRLSTWAAEHPQARIDLLGHSAGCGVILGALKRRECPTVHTVILLNPSVSPGYDLQPDLEKIGGQLHVFHSDRDTFYLSWRTGTFGTYDNVKTKAAGNVGFKDLERLPAVLRERIAQYPHDPAYETMGNDGGHFGTAKEPFVKEVIAPLLK